MQATLTCRACGERVPYAIGRGVVEEITLEHGATCPFIEAIEAGCAPLWIEANGYPLRVDLTRPDGRIVRRGDSA